MSDTSAWRTARDAALQWVAHKDARMGAALSYYSVFSIGPLILIAVAIAGLFFGREAVQGQVTASLQDCWGERRESDQRHAESAGSPAEGLLATIIGIVTLVFAALGVVVQLKDAFNTVWEVVPRQAQRDLGLSAHLRPVARRRSRRRFPAADFHAVDRAAGGFRQVFRIVCAGSRPSGRGLPRLVRRHRPAVRIDVQMAARRAGALVRRVARCDR